MTDSVQTPYRHSCHRGEAFWRCFGIFFLSFGVFGCASTVPASPKGAQAVNAEMELRIQQRVEEGRSRGFPDLRDVTPEIPELPSDAEQRRDRQSILTEAESLVDGADGARQAQDAEAVANARAAALLKAIERDRAAAAAEGSAADEIAKRQLSRN